MIKENLKYTGFRWLINHRTPVRLSSTAHIENSWAGCVWKFCTLWQNH